MRTSQARSDARSGLTSSAPSRAKARAAVVMGDRGGELQTVIGVIFGALLVCAGQRKMQLAALPWEQIVVHRLAQQGMAEAEATVLARDQHLLGDRLAQRLVHRLGLH